MTIAFLDEQLTGRGPARRSSRAHTAPMGPRRSGTRPRGDVSPSRGELTRPRGGTGSAVVVVRPVRPTATPADDRQPATVDQLLESRRAPALRLTARGRLVFGALLVLLVLAIFSIGRFSAGAEASGPPVRVTVAAGDTLWSIAEHAAPGADPRVTIDRIASVNHLSSGATLTPGTVLVVPRG